MTGLSGGGVLRERENSWNSCFDWDVDWAFDLKRSLHPLEAPLPNEMAAVPAPGDGSRRLDHLYNSGECYVVSDGRDHMRTHFRSTAGGVVRDVAARLWTHCGLALDFVGEDGRPVLAQPLRSRMNAAFCHLVHHTLRLG